MKATDRLLRTDSQPTAEFIKLTDDMHKAEQLMLDECPLLDCNERHACRVCKPVIHAMHDLEKALERYDYDRGML